MTTKAWRSSPLGLFIAMTLVCACGSDKSGSTRGDGSLGGNGGVPTSSGTGASTSGAGGTWTGTGQQWDPSNRAERGCGNRCMRHRALHGYRSRNQQVLFRWLGARERRQVRPDMDETGPVHGTTNPGHGGERLRIEEDAAPDQGRANAKVLNLPERHGKTTHKT